MLNKYSILILKVKSYIIKEINIEINNNSSIKNNLLPGLTKIIITKEEENIHKWIDDKNYSVILISSNDILYYIYSLNNSSLNNKNKFAKS